MNDDEWLRQMFQVPAAQLKDLPEWVRQRLDHAIRKEPSVVLQTCINPVGWKAPTAYVVRRGKRLTAAMAPAMEVVAYQEALREALQPQWSIPAITEECRVDLYFSRRLMTYLSDSGRNVTKHRSDMTNMRKSTEDALQPWLVKNDVLITQGWTEIVEQSKEAEGYIRIEIFTNI